MVFLAVPGVTEVLAGTEDRGFKYPETLGVAATLGRALAYGLLLDRRSPPTSRNAPGGALLKSSFM
jgi:hypothetical protein